MRKLKLVLYAVAVFLIAAQFYQPDRTNPPADPSASFEAIAKPPAHAVQVVSRSCGNCHSHATEWPWYSRVAPISWLVARDVREGRAKLNFSQWNIYSPEMSKLRIRAMCNEAKAGEMPPKYYTPMHPDARLSGEDVGALCGMVN